jgi:predicted nucleic acid-binding protein
MLRCAISEPVLDETESNIQDNLDSSAWLRYQEQIKTLPFLIAPTASIAEIAIAQPITGEKDAHVLAAAVALGAPYVITLDRKLARRITEAEFDIQAMTPGTFIQTILPLHPDHHLMRE